MRIASLVLIATSFASELLMAASLKNTSRKRRNEESNELQMNNNNNDSGQNQVATPEPRNVCPFAHHAAHSDKRRRCPSSEEVKKLVDFVENNYNLGLFVLNNVDEKVATIVASVLGENGQFFKHIQDEFEAMGKVIPPEVKLHAIQKYCSETKAKLEKQSLEIEESNLEELEKVKELTAQMDRALTVQVALLQAEINDQSKQDDKK